MAEDVAAASSALVDDIPMDDIRRSSEYLVGNRHRLSSGFTLPVPTTPSRVRGRGQAMSVTSDVISNSFVSISLSSAADDDAMRLYVESQSDGWRRVHIKELWKSATTEGNSERNELLRKVGAFSWRRLTCCAVRSCTK